MKKILYTLVLLSAVFFTGCREEQLEGEVPVKDIALTFSSRSSELSVEELTKEVEKLHLLIFDESGVFYQQKEFAGLADVKPVKLPLGAYTFAYLSNIDENQISGLKEGASLDDVVVALETDANGDVVMPGSIFSGTDEITVGEDKSSEARLSRIVGRLDINVSGLKGGVELRSVALLGSPKSVSFNGTPKDTKARLNVPMNKEGELMKGRAIVFPTCVDSLARLEFVIVENGVDKIYVAELKNKVEANKIHSINVKVNVMGDIFDVEIEMSVEEWGETMSEDIIANEKLYANGWVVRLATGNVLENLEQIQEVTVSFIDGKNKIFGINGRKDDEMQKLEVFGDTLVISSFGRQECGNFTIRNIEILDSEMNRLYALPAPVKNVVLDTMGLVHVALPAMLEVAENDKTALLELRDAMREAGVDLPSSWVGNNINLWYEVELNTEGRVVGIGYSNLDDYDYDYDRSRFAKTASTTMSRAVSRTADMQSVWVMPASFKNLTALRYCNISDEESDYGVLSEIPAFIKEIPNLEELAVTVNSTTLPELPAGLKYLEVRSKTLTRIPAHIGDLTRLQVLIVTVPDYEENEEYDYDYLPALSQASVSSVEMSFDKLTELKALCLVGATNCELPNGIWDLPGGDLHELGLYGFSRIQVPASVSKWNVLEDLTFGNAKMTPVDIEAIKELKLNDLMIYSPVFGQGGLPAWLGGMSWLEYLTLYDCGITSIPDSFDGLVNLHDLDMPRNPNLTGKLPSVLLRRYNDGMLSVYAPESKEFTPDGLWLEVTPERIYAPVEGGVYTVDIKTNSEWSCQLNASMNDFVTVIPEQGEFFQNDSIVGTGVLSGSGNATLKVIVKEAMFSGWSYSGHLQVRVGTQHSAYISIEQEMAQEERLETSVKDSCSLMAGDMFVLDVSSNTEWEVRSELIDGEGWLNMEPSYGTGNGTLTGVLEMPDGVASCTILVILRSWGSGEERVITVIGRSHSGEIPRDSTNMK
ncbi:FimB/Mfa2 family fimbrial subunit [Butyricimonas sp. Marseille-P3923]|uniref:FimB/Mfa2 family fimbrial subunit n=1 Tax=Butyricimonas sp. Marseille-P3923 TaxID=1987504 RepID=UPI000C075B33|nr:FimB/Mfa2 family fimbrial subunit [Butyricimonas sp. Marseille-P3923]